MGIIQKIRTVLIPEIGLEVEPKFVQEAVVSTDFGRTIAHIAAQTGNRSILIKSNSDGRLLVAMAGGAAEVYAVENGNAPDAYNAGSTFEFALAQYTTDILVETNGATIAFRNSLLAWGDDKAVPVGMASIDFIHYGIRIQNRVALAVAAYEITTYR